MDPFIDLYFFFQLHIESISIISINALEILVGLVGGGNLK